MKTSDILNLRERGDLSRAALLDIMGDSDDEWVVEIRLSAWWGYAKLGERPSQIPETWELA